MNKIIIKELEKISKYRYMYVIGTVNYGIWWFFGILEIAGCSLQKPINFCGGGGGQTNPTISWWSMTGDDEDIKG